MTKSLDLTADIIDVRDIIERFEELENLNDDEITHDEVSEFVTIKTILKDLKGNGGDEQWRGDWYPTILIRDSYFNDYMDDMVAGCYEVPKDLPSFMTITLDYRALQMDYTSTEIEGVTYWYR